MYFCQQKYWSVLVILASPDTTSSRKWRHDYTYHVIIDDCLLKALMTSLVGVWSSPSGKWENLSRRGQTSFQSCNKTLSVMKWPEGLLKTILYFLPPSLSLSPLSFFICLVCVWLHCPSVNFCLHDFPSKKVPMMHGGNPATVSAATTSATSVPFATASTNQVCTTTTM